MSRQTDPTEAKFLLDVREHVMTVVRDDGVDRHLRFRKPGTYCMGFDIITWPGYLCYTGDMGTYVFTRLEDMFEFFRTDRKYRPELPGLKINRSYWAEKCVGVDRGGIKEFSKERFREQVEYWIGEDRIGNPPSDELREAIEDDVYSHLDDGQYAAMQAAIDFEHEGFRLTDFWEADSTEYTFHFTWCCYALAWAILKYDESTVGKK